MIALSPTPVLETERLVLRCWRPSDAPLLRDAVDSSLDHLREWMPWAEDEPSGSSTGSSPGAVGTL